MKFLCVPCDTPMSLEDTRTNEGSVCLTYSCRDCGYEFAMWTNPMETQVVSSLGVKIGAESGEDGVGAGESKCPFTGMVRAMEGESESAERAVPWTPQAEARMNDVPEFVKPMVRAAIERFARDSGSARVDEAILEEAKGAFGMKEFGGGSA